MRGIRPVDHGTPFAVLTSAQTYRVIDRRLRQHRHALSLQRVGIIIPLWLDSRKGCHTRTVEVVSSP